MQSKYIVRSITYVCTERIFDSRTFIHVQQNILETRLKVNLALDHELTKIKKPIKAIHAIRQSRIKAINTIIKTNKENKIQQVSNTNNTAKNYTIFHY